MNIEVRRAERTGGPVLAADRGAEAFWRALGFTPFIQRLWAPFAADARR